MHKNPAPSKGRGISLRVTTQCGRASRRDPRRVPAWRRRPWPVNDGRSVGPTWTPLYPGAAVQPTTRGPCSPRFSGPARTLPGSLRPVQRGYSSPSRSFKLIRWGIITNIGQEWTGVKGTTSRNGLTLPKAVASRVRNVEPCRTLSYLSLGRRLPRVYRK